MIMKMKIILIVFILTVYSISFASASIKDTISKTHNKNESIELIKSENSKLLKQNTEIAELLKWSIRSILLIIIVVLGSSVYFNFRLSSKEVENINKGIELQIEKHKIEVEATISEKLESLENKYKDNTKRINDDFTLLTKEINSTIKTDNSKLVESFQNQLDEFNSNYRQQIVSIEKSFDSQIKSYEKTLEQLKENVIDRIEKNSESIKSANNSFHKNIKWLEKHLSATIYRNAGYMWESKEVFVNSLRSYILECEIHIELKNNPLIKLSLINIKDIIKKMDEINEENMINELDKLFSKLPSEYNIIIAEIRELISKIKVIKS